MKIRMSSKVLKYMQKQNFDGIILSKETVKFGWAGCKDTFRGEFVEQGKEIKNRDAYKEYECEGMRVFVPASMQKYEKIELTSNFSFFKALVLSVDVYK